MPVVIIIILLWLCLSRLIYIIVRNKEIALSPLQVLVFFGCKIIAGEVYGYIFKRFYNGDDTWKLQHDSILQYKRLMQSPAQFIADIFSAVPVPGTGEFYFQSNSYFENLEYAITTKTVAIFNLVSQGNYYINIVFFNFLGFWGTYLLYKLLATRLENHNRPFIATILFLFPPALFWLSGLRTEGLLLLFTAIVFYQFNTWLSERRPISILICTAGFMMVFILRNGFAMLLMPALFAWWLTVTQKTEIKKTFALTCIACAALACCSSLLFAKMNVLNIIAARQHEFLALNGNTRFNLTELEGRPMSFIKVLPEAALNTFIRPFLWESKGILQWFAAIENLTILLLLAATVFKLYTTGKLLRLTPLLLVLLMTAVCNYIIIGYIVPFPGAIVRYKIIPELFLISACLITVPPVVYFRKDQPVTASLQI